MVNVVRPRAVFLPASPAVQAPTGFFTHGTQVGVPTGTSLTPTTNLPAADATENWDISNPITSTSATLNNCSVWRRRSWNQQLQVTPPSGGTYVFDECLFENSLDNFILDIIDTNFTPNKMLPLVVLNRCSFEGNDSTSRCVNGGPVYMQSCHLTGTEDAYGGLYYSILRESNFIPTTDSGVDPHQDGIQCAGIGDSIVWRCAVSAGTDPASNSAIRAGTDFSAIADLWIWYNYVERGGYSMQFRGDPGARGITGLSVKGNRWAGSAPNGLAGFGPIDSVDTTYSLWEDNKFLGDGSTISQP